MCAHLMPKIINDQTTKHHTANLLGDDCKPLWNILNYLKIFLKLCPTLNSNQNIKILIISGAPIWVIFHNSVTIIVTSLHNKAQM